MTNTEAILPPETRISGICSDCAAIIANDDDSGCTDGPAVREAISQLWSGYRLVVGEEVEMCCLYGDCGLLCDTCGRRCGEVMVAFDGWAFRTD